MTPSILVFSPELEGILHDVAADPNAILLRAPRANSAVRLFKESSPPGPMAGGLSNAERELLRAHSDELAAVLRDACWATTQAVGRQQACLDRHDGLGQAQPVPSAVELQLRAERGHSGAPHSVTPILDRLISRDRASPLTVADLAAASYRFQPSDHARICLAVDLIWRQQPKEALELSLEVALNGTQLSNRIAGWRNAATASEGLANLQGAVAFARTAMNLADGYAYPALNCLFLAIQAAEKRDALQAAAVLGAVPSESIVGLDSFANDVKSRRAAGRWRPTHDSVTFITTLERQVGSQFYFDVFH